jgi:hypothetical protein
MTARQALVVAIRTSGDPRRLLRRKPAGGRLRSHRSAFGGTAPCFIGSGTYPTDLRWQTRTGGAGALKFLVPSGFGRRDHGGVRPARPRDRRVTSTENDFTPLALSQASKVNPRGRLLVEAEDLHGG